MKIKSNNQNHPYQIKKIPNKSQSTTNHKIGFSIAFFSSKFKLNFSLTRNLSLPNEIIGFDLGRKVGILDIFYKKNIIIVCEGLILQTGKLLATLGKFFAHFLLTFSL